MQRDIVPPWPGTNVYTPHDTAHIHTRGTQAWGTVEDTGFGIRRFRLCAKGSCLCRASVSSRSKCSLGAQDWVLPPSSHMNTRRLHQQACSPRSRPFHGNWKPASCHPAPGPPLAAAFWGGPTVCQAPWAVASCTQPPLTPSPSPEPPWNSERCPPPSIRGTRLVPGSHRTQQATREAGASPGHREADPALAMCRSGSPTSPPTSALTPLLCSR